MYDDETAQVSMNLLDYSVTGLFEVTEAIRDEAAKIGLSVVAGELVGLVPLNAMLDAGRKYGNGDSDDDTLVQIAIERLMLNALDDFDPAANIIEWAIEER